jgi:hypothetical protein
LLVMGKWGLGLSDLLMTLNCPAGSTSMIRR